MAGRGIGRAGLALLLVAAAGCVVVVENVTYGRGHRPVGAAQVGVPAGVVVAWLVSFSRR